MKRLRIYCIALIISISCPTAFAEHNLREIQRRCEVQWSGKNGELSCSSSVSDRRSLERSCSVRWTGSQGEFDCSGSHFKDVERRCTADKSGNIDC
jgi:hypothetical protein